MDTQKKDEKALVVLTQGQLKDIYEKAAAIGANEALKTFRQEQKKEYSRRADRRLRNTKLLLRNYHMLKEHAENSVFGRTQMEESALDILYMAEDTLSAKEVAEKQHVSKDTVYTDIRMATEKLTALIFGVDGLNVQ